MNVYMPKLGLSMQEGTIVQWLVSEGTAVKKGEGIVDISSEKLTNTIEADVDGVLNKIFYEEGDVIACGEVIAEINESSAPKTNGATIAGSTVPAAPAAESTESPEDPWRKISSRMPLSPARKEISERMARSLARSPQASLTTRADVSSIVTLRRKLLEQNEQISYTDIFTKIIVTALQENALLNASMGDDEIILYESINIGVAVAAESTLLVPVVRNCQEKSLKQISEEIDCLSRKAKEDRLCHEDLAGSTFTFSNLGMLDVDVMTPILNPPESAILAAGRFQKEAVVDEDENITIRPMVTLSLSIDHGVIDGYPAAKFLESIKKWIAEPEKLA